MSLYAKLKSGFTEMVVACTAELNARKHTSRAKYFATVFFIRLIF